MAIKKLHFLIQPTNKSLKIRQFYNKNKFTYSQFKNYMYLCKIILTAEKTKIDAKVNVYQ